MQLSGSGLRLCFPCQTPGPCRLQRQLGWDQSQWTAWPWVRTELAAGFRSDGTAQADKESFAGQHRGQVNPCRHPLGLIQTSAHPSWEAERPRGKPLIPAPISRADSETAPLSVAGSPASPGDCFAFPSVRSSFPPPALSGWFLAVGGRIQPGADGQAKASGRAAARALAMCY